MKERLSKEQQTAAAPWHPVFGLARVCLLICASLACPFVFAEEKKDEKKKEPPAVLVATPFSASPGSKVVFKIRGLRLEPATEIRFAGAKPVVAIKSKTKVEAKEVDAKKGGDNQIEAEITFAPETAVGDLKFTVVSPDGESQPYTLAIVPAEMLVAEKEANGGFATAQEIPFGKLIQGAINQKEDVDVFKFSAKAGQNIAVEIIGGKHGSCIEPLLTLYNEKNHLIKSNAASDLSSFSATIPADGTYFLVLNDANDRGGGTHPYQLRLLLK